MLTIVTAAIVLIAGAAINIPPKEVVDMFEHRLHPYPLTAQHNGHMLYSLFKPRNIKPGKKYPLVVWLHGYGREEFEEQYGNLMHVENILPSVEVARQAQYFLLVPQCPTDQRGFFISNQNARQTSFVSYITPGDATVQIIKQLLTSEQIAPEMISVLGISGGGNDAFEIASRYQGLFAAISPQSASGCDVLKAAQLTDVSTWAFNSSAEAGSVNAIRHAIDAIKNLQGKAEVTVIPANIHGCWCSAFTDYDLLLWLLSQKRGSIFSPAPGHRPWKWHTWGAIIALPVLTFESVRREILRRQKSLTLYSKHLRRR